eukprot:1577282-Rhodomonas_salina.1
MKSLTCHQPAGTVRGKRGSAREREARGKEGRRAGGKEGRREGGTEGEGEAKAKGEEERMRRQGWEKGRAKRGEG